MNVHDADLYVDDDEGDQLMENPNEQNQQVREGEDEQENDEEGVGDVRDGLPHLPFQRGVNMRLRQRDDDDSDEQKGEDVEGEDEQDDEEIDVVNESDDVYEQRSFDHSCRRIAKDDPDFTSFHTTRFEDDEAVQLGRALLGNTKLTELFVWLRRRDYFTSRGARALAGGILGSQIEELRITYVGEVRELPLELAQLCARSIKVVDLLVPMGDDFVVRLSESLMSSNLLEHLAIKLDQMTPRGAQALSNLFRTSPITVLVLTCDSYCRTDMMQTLYEGIQHSQNIRSVTLYWFVGDMHALTTTLSKLQELHIKCAHLSLAKVKILSRALRGTNILKSLLLVECHLNDEHMSALSPGLGSNRSIKSLSFAYSQIGDAGITSFVEHWSPESKIEDLNLTSNNISDKGALLLIRAMSNHATTSLNLEANKAIGYVGLKLIGNELPGRRLRKLRLNSVVQWIEYEDDSCKAALQQEAQLKEAGQALLQGIRGNCHILGLFVYGDSLPRNVMDEIQLYAKANTFGRSQLYEHHHTLPPGVWCYFLTKKGMDCSLMFMFLKEVPSLLTGCCGASKSRGRKRCLSS